MEAHTLLGRLNVHIDRPPNFYDIRTTYYCESESTLDT